MQTSIATVSLSGDLTTKLEAIAAAGFDSYELFENDLTFSSLPPAELRARTADLGLTMFALQPFRDFEGLLDARRGAAFDQAERKLDLMEQLGTDLLLIPSSVSPHATDSVERSAEDLRELGDRAARRGFRVAYEALAWGRHVRDWTMAWEIVRAAGHNRVGLVLDTYHLFVRGNPIGSVREVPTARIFMVQLADAPSLDMEVLRHSRHLRNFPGQSDYPIVDFMVELLAIGYDDVLSHEIFNDELRIAPAEQIAVDGYRSMMWLEERLAQRNPPHVSKPTEATRTSRRHDGAVRFAFNTANGSDTAPERFRAVTQGSGVQHIALATPSIAETVKNIDPAIVLSIPDNYHLDVQARFGLDDRFVEFLRRHNILYDATDDGTFLHLYTYEIHGVFFEFVERQIYEGFGAANAPVRLAAQSRSLSRKQSHSTSG